MSELLTSGGARETFLGAVPQWRRNLLKGLRWRSVMSVFAFERVVSSCRAASDPLRLSLVSVVVPYMVTQHDLLEVVV
jgi:hypothetical protein